MSAEPSPKRHSYGAALVVAGQLLELDRRLALVGHRLAHPKDRSDRVEESAHAGRKRSVHVQALPYVRQRSHGTGRPASSR